MSLLDLIDRAITERGFAAILRERLLLIQDQAKTLEKQLVELQQEKDRLEKEVAELKRQLAQKTVAEEFVEERGALFKRKPAGGYHKAVFCPLCKLPMASVGGELPYRCARCDVRADFNGAQLEEIMRELPA